MTGKTHMAIGITAGLAASIGQPVENQLILVLASALGSLIPDLDHPKSKLNQKLLLFKNKFYQTLFYISLGAGFIYLYFITANNIYGFLGIILFFVGISTHRSFTHSILGFLVFSWIVKLITSKYNLYPVYSGFIIGYLSHLAADFITVKGIKLFYPLNKNISSPIMIKTNGMIENIIFSLLVMYSVYLLYNYL